MSSLISLGSFNTNSSTGKTSGLGLVSGLDSASLIDGILKSRTDGVTAIQDKITANGKKTTAISSLSTLLSTLQTTADFLRGQTGVGKQDSDFFKHTTTTLSSSTSDAASNYLTVTSQAGSTINSYKVENIVTAHAQILRKDGFTSVSSSVVGASSTFQAGTFTLRGSSITLVDGDTLTSIKSKVNAISKTSGVTADIVKVSDSSFSLVLKATTTGEDNDITEYTGTHLTFGAASVAFTQQQEANNASFDLDGLSITRQTNAISDAVSGVTFSLLSDTGDTSPPTITVNVQPDTTIITNGVDNFITAYNNLKEFISQQTQKDSSGNFVSTAVLGDSSIIGEVSNAIDSIFSSIVSGLKADLTDPDDLTPVSLFDIGIDTATFPGDDTTPKTVGILTLDQAKFSAAIASDFDAFRKVFSTSFVASSADIGLFKSSNSSTLTKYTLDIDTSRAVGDQVRVLDATTGSVLFNADFSGNLITGQTGTALAGDQFIYTGDGSETISVVSTQGIADKVYNKLADYLKATTGLIATTTQSITDQDTQLQKNIDAENLDIAAERKILVAKFTQLESIISQANSTLSFLDAQTASNNATNN